MKRTEQLKKAYEAAALRAMPSAKVSQEVGMVEYAPRRGMALLGVDAWVKYSRNSNWYVKNRVLVLKDRDSGEFNAVRVSPQIEKITDALEWLKPAEVKAAEKSEKRILRQGDMYFIPQRIWNLNELRHSNHTIEIQSGRNGAFYRYPFDDIELNGKPVYIRHPHHKTLKLTAPHKVRQQITVFGRGHAD